MSARSKSVWHRCGWCGERFRPYEATDRYCCHRHYALAKRITPEVRYCALPECGRRFLVGGTTIDGGRRADRHQRYHAKRCAGIARERSRARSIHVPRLRPGRRGALVAALDGEGWVSGRIWVIEIGNTNRAWLQGLRRFAGEAGGIREDLAHQRHAHWKRFWRWRVYGADAYGLLKQCLPDLVVKRARAERFVRRYQASHPRTGGPP